MRTSEIIENIERNQEKIMMWKRRFYNKERYSGDDCMVKEWKRELDPLKVLDEKVLRVILSFVADDLVKLVMVSGRWWKGWTGVWRREIEEKLNSQFN